MENLSSILQSFFEAAEHDPRIGVSHVSLFCALVKESTKTQNNLIFLKSCEIMKSAKIAGTGTYHKCIWDLHHYGYIHYAPSFNHRKKSRIVLLTD